jgi:hypothetical protein
VSPAPTTPLAVWRAYNDASNTGDHDTAGRYLDPGLAVLVNGAPAVSSIEEDRAIQSELIRCYPDYTRDYLAGFEDGEWATVEWRMRGTAADGVDLPPLDVPGCSVVRCVDGRLTAARLYHPTGALDRVADRALGRG